MCISWCKWLSSNAWNEALHKSTDKELKAFHDSERFWDLGHDHREQMQAVDRHCFEALSLIHFQTPHTMMTLVEIFVFVKRKDENTLPSIRDASHEAHVNGTCCARIFLRVHIIRMKFVLYCTFVLSKAQNPEIKPGNNVLCFWVLYFQKCIKTITFSITSSMLSEPGLYFLYLMQDLACAVGL